MNVNWDYTMPVTEREYSSLSPSIQTEEESYRFASAMRFSKEYGLTMENAMVRLDELTQWQTGKAFTPEKTTWKSIVDSIEIGKIQPKLMEAQRNFKYAELAGQDTKPIEAQISNYENIMSQLGDSTPRNLVTQAIKYGAENLPYVVDVTMKGATLGLGAGLATAAVAGIAGVSTVGALPVAAATSIIAVASAAGTAFTFGEVFKTLEGGEYYRLRKNGVPKEVALPVSNISSWVQSGIEIALGTVASKLGFSTNTLTSKVLAKLAISGKWGAVGLGLANLTGQSLEEGAEEAAQSVSSWVADIVAAEIADIQAPERTMSVVKEAMLSAKGGFLASLFMSGAGTAVSTISDARVLGTLKSDAQTIPSKEAYIEKYKGIKPEGVTPKEWDSQLSKIHESNRPSVEEQAVKEIDTTSEAHGPLNRLKSGKLYTQESTAVDILPDGSEARSLLVGDPVTGDRYGYISYNIKGNTIEIDDVRFGTEYESSRKDAILELGRQNPNMEMVWNPETESLQDIRESIITEQGSLNPFTAGPEVETRMDVEQQIAKAMPNLDAPQRIAASVLLEARAEAKGLSLQEYLDKSFSKDIFGGNIQGKRGGIEFKQFEDGVKALIYAGKNADFSTFAHETFHLFRKEMTQTSQLQTALTQASQDARFDQYVQDNQSLLNVSPEQAKSILETFGKDWTREQEELSAKLWELYLKEGKAPTSRLQAFFDKFAKWFSEIYNKLTGRVQLDPRIREVFDSLLDKDSPLAQEARKTQQQEIVETDTQFQDDSPQSQYDAVVAQYKDTPQWLKAPNGKPTNLTERQWVLVRTPAFMEWFGDFINDPENASKVIDKNGDPLVVYHATTDRIEEFQYKYLGENTLENASDEWYAATSGVGFWFSKDDLTGRVGATSLKIQKPIEAFLSIKEPSDQSFEGLAGNIVDTHDETQYEDGEKIDSIYEGKRYRTELEKYGYDGLIVDDTEFDTVSYVAFSPTQIKSATENVGSFDAENPNILFQEDIISEAAQFSSWEDFRDGYSAFLEAMYGEVPDMDDEWYRNTWERANPQGNDQAMDERFVQSMESEGLLPFLKEMGRILTERVEAPDDQDMMDYNTRMSDLKYRIQKASPTIVSNAIGSLSKIPNATELKKIRTTMSNASRMYRDLYADVMDRPDMKPIVLDDFLPAITEPEYEAVERISIADRIRLSQRIEATELKQKLLSGEELFDGEAEKVVRQMDIEISDIKTSIAKLEGEYRDTRLSLNASDRKVVDLQDQIDEARKALTKAQKNIQKRINRNQEISKALTDERRTLSEQVKALMAQFNELSKNNRTMAAMEKGDAVKKATTLLREKQKARNEARKVREYKTKLAAKIMAPVSQSIDYAYKLPILAIQATLDPKFRSGKVKYNNRFVQLNDIKTIVESIGDYDIAQTLPARIVDRMNKTSLNDMTITDLEEIASRVATLRKTGRLVQQAHQVFQSELANSIRQSVQSNLLATGKFVEPPPTGSVEDVKQKKGLLEKGRSILYATWNLARKAQMLDNYRKEGPMQELLVQRPRDAYRQKMVNFNQRVSKVLSSVEDMKEFYKTAYDRIHVGDYVYTRSDLAMFYLGAKNKQSREALAYGNLVTPLEKQNMTNEEVRSIGNQRLEEVLAVAELELDASMRSMMDAISADFTDNFERLNTIAIQEFNTPVTRLENYVPIRRQEITGDDLRTAVADDLLNMNGQATPSGVQRGMTKERIAISPTNQKPMKLDLIGTWQEAVDMQEHFIAYAELIRDLNRTIMGYGSESMRSSIKGTFGDAMLSDIDDGIKEIINPKSFQRLDRSGKFIRSLRGNLGAAYLAYKTSGVVLQLITSPMPFLSEVNPIQLASAYLDVTTHPVEMMNQINNLSVVMKERTMDPIVQLLKDEQGKYSGAGSQAFKRFQEIGMMGLTMADKWSVAGGWLAVFRKEMAKADSTSADAVNKAVRIADDAVLRTQPAGRSEELSPLFKAGGEGMKILTQFQTALNIIWQNISFDVPMFIRQSRDTSLPKGIRKERFAKAVGQIVGYVLAGGILGAVANGFDDDDNDSDKVRKMLYYSLTQFTDAVPLIGSLVNNLAESIITGETPYIYPTTVYPATTELMKGVINLSQQKLEAGLKDLAEGFGYATGLPVSGTKQVIRAFEEGAEALLGRIE